MKRLLFIGLGLALLTACSKTEVKNDWQLNDLKGKVQTLKEYSYQAVKQNGTITKGARERDTLAGAGQDKILTFNKNGGLVQDEEFNSKGQLASKTQFQYEKNGRKKDAMWFLPDGSLFLKTTYSYDKHGNLSAETRTHSDGSMQDKQTYQYDKDGNKNEQDWLDGSGNTNSTWTYFYDKNRNLIEEDWADAQGKPLYTRTLRYGTNGNLNSQAWYLTKGGNSEWTYHYDSKNYLVKASAKLGDGSKVEEIYTPDVQGNWVKAVHFKNGQPTYIIERTLTYFK